MNFNNTSFEKELREQLKKERIEKTKKDIERLKEELETLKTPLSGPPPGPPSGPPSGPPPVPPSGPPSGSVPPPGPGPVPPPEPVPGSLVGSPRVIHTNVPNILLVKPDHRQKLFDFMKTIRNKDDLLKGLNLAKTRKNHFR